MGDLFLRQFTLLTVCETVIRTLLIRPENGFSSFFFSSKSIAERKCAMLSAVNIYICLEKKSAVILRSVGTSRVVPNQRK